MNKNNKGNATVSILITGLLFFVVAIGFNITMGIGGFGPVSHINDVTVIGKHVDISKDSESSSTHYMVSTNKGTFEVDNGILLDTWNADEIYGGLEIGKSYHIVIKGNKFVGMFFQSYPYILKVTPN